MVGKVTRGRNKAMAKSAPAPAPRVEELAPQAPKPTRAQSRKAAPPRDAGNQAAKSRPGTSAAASAAAAAFVSPTQQAIHHARALEAADAPEAVDDVWVTKEDHEVLDAEINPESLVVSSFAEKRTPPPCLVMPLLPYQKEFLAWGIEQELGPMRGGILADEMGLGKTIQAVCMIVTHPREGVVLGTIGGEASSSPAARIGEYGASVDAEPPRLRLRLGGPAAPPPLPSASSQSGRVHAKSPPPLPAASASPAALASTSMSLPTPAATTPAAPAPSSGTAAAPSADAAAPATKTKGGRAKKPRVDLMRVAFEQSKNSRADVDGKEAGFCGATLVVCPVVAAMQWRQEIARYTAPGTLKVVLYHGANRASEITRAQLESADVVLTTFSILEIDYRKAIMAPKAMCSYCNKKFQPERLKVHLRYFCGPYAQKTDKQALQQKKGRGMWGRMYGKSNGASTSAKGGGSKTTAQKRSRGAKCTTDDEADDADALDEDAEEPPLKKAKGAAGAALKASGKAGTAGKRARPSKATRAASSKSCGTPSATKAEKSSRVRGGGSAASRPKPTRAAGKASAKAAPRSSGKKATSSKNASSSAGGGGGGASSESDWASQAASEDLEESESSDEDGAVDLVDSEDGSERGGAGGGGDAAEEDDDDDGGLDGMDEAELDAAVDAEAAEMIAAAQALRDKEEQRSSVLHEIKWRRVVLDEAHNIKDRRCNTAQSAFALKALYRWALSGTPLQNRVTELYSLIRFLRIYPYAHYFADKTQCCSLDFPFKNDFKKCDLCGGSRMSHYCWFNRRISNPIKFNGYVGTGKTAMLILKHQILPRILLRRTKLQCADDLALPPRRLVLRKDAFDEREADFYEALYTQSQAQFSHYVKSGTVLNNYAHIFDLLIRLRQAVNHPYLVVYSASGGRNDNDGAASSSESAPPLGVCGICHDPIEDGVAAQCAHAFCRLCLNEFLDNAVGACKCPVCASPLTVDLSAPSTGPAAAKPRAAPRVKKSSILSRIKTSAFQSSTKVEALCMEVDAMLLADASAKCIVFSQFTSMLDIVQFRLQQVGVQCVKLEGSMSLDVRAKMIASFNTDPAVKVFLMSLKAGGVALNLTVASHVMLMDPWWNPAVEQQAADRIHRLGQFKPITVTRFVIGGTIEERILKLQEKKQLIFEGTVGKDAEALGKLTVDDLRFLFG